MRALRAMGILAMAAAGFAASAGLARADVTVLMSSLQTVEGSKEAAMELAGPLGPAWSVKLSASCEGACRAKGFGWTADSGIWSGNGQVKWDGAGRARFALAAPSAQGPVEWSIDGPLSEGVKAAAGPDGSLVLEAKEGAYANLVFSEPYLSAGVVKIRARELGEPPFIAPEQDSAGGHLFAGGLALAGFASVLGGLAWADRKNRAKAAAR